MREVPVETLFDVREIGATGKAKPLQTWLAL